ncbi:Acyltransferase-like protein - chloroplastic [Striga hermonthica]|uniref:Acyltransferase-like protein - chloroplastic n=1 Tax=Striga hermonthica TaxID=68872 RepID=A0A9N7R593_STRHE|nr:Acyltransferase-like protein - chloroplastic [Striga hermonthica]
MEDVNLLTVLKANCFYRCSKRHDHVADFLPPSESEYRKAFDGILEFFRVAISPVMYLTLNDGKIVREGCLTGDSACAKVFGALPATSADLFKQLSRKSHVLLYPGGIREALHRKGEKYRLFWPDEPKFVRMEARFRAKIVPFGVMGEDDLVKLFIDYDNLIRIPFAKEMIRRTNKNVARIGARDEKKGEVSKEFFMPGFYPKLAGPVLFCVREAYGEGRQGGVGER